jgi:predicted DNA-binding antitoxin AbrB/MazE fold protein
MGATIKARFSDGTLKPLEALDLREGDEVTITIVSSPSKSRVDWLEAPVEDGRVWLMQRV